VDQQQLEVGWDLTALLTQIGSYRAWAAIGNDVVHQAAYRF